MQQKLARAQWITVKNIAHLIRAYVHVKHEHFAVFYLCIAVAQVYFSKTDRLYLRTHKLNARFVGIVYEKVVSGFFIFGDDFNSAAHIRPLFLL